MTTTPSSCALVGCLIGSLVTGGLSDQLGRKKLLLASAFLFAVSSVNFVEAYLPEALRNDNPLGIRRLVNGSPESPDRESRSKNFVTNAW